MFYLIVSLSLLSLYSVTAQIVEYSPLVPFLTNDCDVNKECFLSPPSCTFDTCTTLLTWKTGTLEDRSGGRYAVYELVGQAPRDGRNPYLALAFSTDNLRGNDYIVACGWNGTKAFMRFAYQSQGGYMEILPERGYTYAAPYDYVYYNPSNGRISCSFAVNRDIQPTRKQLVPMIPGIQFNYMLFIGTEPDLNDYPLPSDPLDLSKNSGLVYFSPAERPMTSKIWHGLPKKSPSVGVRAHAILMLISWMWLASIGILTARYMKTTFATLLWRNDTTASSNRTPVYLDGRGWFQIHLCMQIIVVALTMISFVLIFIYEGKWVGPDFPVAPENAHPILGCIVVALALLNFILGWCAPRPLTRGRCVWNWFHWFIGSATHCLAVPTMFIGMSMKAWAWYAPVILFIWVIFHVIVEIILEIHSCCLACCYKDSKNDAAKKDAEPLVFQTADGKKVLLHTGPPPRRDGSTFRTILWGIHAGVTSILAIVLCFVLALTG